MPFNQKNNANPAGRKRGSPNKITKEARQMFLDIISGQTKKVESALSKLAGEDPYKYLLVMAKLLSYVMPKHIDVTSNSEALPAPVIILKTEKTNNINGTIS